MIKLRDGATIVRGYSASDMTREDAEFQLQDYVDQQIAVAKQQPWVDMRVFRAEMKRYKREALRIWEENQRDI